MQFKDITGSALVDGDQVLFSLGLGQTTLATIKRTDSGLNPQNPQSSVTITVDVTLPAAPNGFVPGIVKIVAAQSQLTQ